MGGSQEIWGDQADRDEINRQHVIIEMQRDFIIWMFEESGELDHVTLKEAESKHEKYLETT